MTTPVGPCFIVQRKVKPMRLKHLALPIIAIVSLTAITSCTPREVEVFKSLSPAEQGEVISHLKSKNASTDCYQAIEKHWPTSTHSWAKSIVDRESRNNPAAQNSRSSAAGCMQLLKLHSGRFQKLGFSWERDRYNADANIIVAADLYREVGSSPWRL